MSSGWRNWGSPLASQPIGHKWLKGRRIISLEWGRKNSKAVKVWIKAHTLTEVSIKAKTNLTPLKLRPETTPPFWRRISSRAEAVAQNPVTVITSSDMFRAIRADFSDHVSTYTCSHQKETRQASIGESKKRTNVCLMLFSLKHVCFERNNGGYKKSNRTNRHAQ